MAAEHATPIAILGNGLLANALIKRPGVHQATSVAEVDAGCRMIVVATDGWDDSAYHSVRAVAARFGRPWLPVRTELGRIVIGPVEQPGVPGCGICVERRRAQISATNDGVEAVHRAHGTVLATRSSSWLTTLAADVATSLVLREADRLTSKQDEPRAACGYLDIDLASLVVRRHEFLPDPLCPNCGYLPDDSPVLAHIRRTRQPKPAPDHYRIRSVADELPALMGLYVDSECGLIRSVSKDQDGGVVIAAAPVGLRIEAREFGFGRSRNYRDSQVTAILEALERYGGVRPGGKRTSVRASYAEVRDNAVNPRTLGLYPADRYLAPGFRFQPFSETQPYRWVWGYSFARQDSILVPETYAYYGVSRLPEADIPFVFETSNGCALGSCAAEAILHGVLEIAERDAFLMAWYARLPVPRIDLDSAVDKAIPLTANALRAETGYEVMAFDTTTEQGIPCVWVMAVDPVGDGERPKAVCAAGAHLDPEHAIENALNELGPIVADLIRRHRFDRERARSLATDPGLVVEMADHSLLYANPEVFSRLDFLASSGPSIPISAMAQPTAFRNDDLEDDLDELVRRYLNTGLDVIVVDQTTPEHRAGDFSCVKVIIPGTLPMTFGHDLRRVDGLPRLYDIPSRLGRRLRRQDVNPHPHPFP
ncbi:TOMM precursor leader peptide-binding protein [Actinokineospora cianjurensis]|uniref:Ribosomal protein S12 methylthiotransferase accessory factor n=1 Tax=Actinokineospora cianjurensis TaxID=585224 RepID=A0A421B504_9PSEU|nr:TOMM precursor leader peptide-binding protein [Actinokineospora cianjurensis]RLK59471.1 ribosomal protein S12 methylthiotransferase accessory factor [Actinokineospora cianjurensis]